MDFSVRKEHQKYASEKNRKYLFFTGKDALEK